MTDASAATEATEDKSAVKTKTAAYIVTMPNTLDHKVGDEIPLTEKQAKTLINKVRLKDSGTSESKAGRKSRIETEHGELTKRVAELETRAEEGNSRIADLEAQNLALHDENVKLKLPPDQQ